MFSGKNDWPTNSLVTIEGWYFYRNAKSGLRIDWAVGHYTLPETFKNVTKQIALM